MKKCFVVSPIGKPGSEARERSDSVLEFIICPALSELDYEVTRADKIAEAGMITTQIIDRLTKDDLVVADLTDYNPNVFYEIAVRHAVRKPLIQIIEEGQALPFDVAGMRTISFDHRSLPSVHSAIESIKHQAHAFEESPDEVDSPISITMNLMAMRNSANPEERSVAELIESISEIRSMISQLSMFNERAIRREVERAIHPLFARLTGSSEGVVSRDVIAQNRRLQSFIEELLSLDEVEHVSDELREKAKFLLFDHRVSRK